MQMDNKDRLIVAQNCNSATAQVMAALVGNAVFSYEDVRAHWGDLHSIINGNCVALTIHKPNHRLGSQWSSSLPTPWLRDKAQCHR
jgi:hypothetical protein